MKKLLWTPVITLALAAGFVAEATAQANPNQLIAQRKGAMDLQGKYFGPILAMVQGRMPYDAAIVQRNADYLAVLTQMAWDDFQPTTASATNTKAKEDIYKDPAKFKTAADNMQGEVKKLVAAAKSGDQSAVGVAAKGLGGACNACHENFSTMEWRFKVQ